MKIFVENLTHSATNNDLIKLFELYGDVKSITIVNDKISGKPGGFVEMPNRQEAFEVIERINGMSLFGKPLKLTLMWGGSERRADFDRRSSQKRRENSERRIVTDRRIKSVVYAFDERRVNFRRISESDRRRLISRRMSSE